MLLSDAFAVVEDGIFLIMIPQTEANAVMIEALAITS